MNYEKFRAVWVNNPLTHRALALYFALVEIACRCQSNSFTASDKQLMRMLNINSSSAYTKIKRELIEKGYIQYIPSHKIGVASSYQLSFPK